MENKPVKETNLLVAILTLAYFAVALPLAFVLWYLENGWLDLKDVWSEKDGKD